MPLQEQLQDFFTLPFYLILILFNPVILIPAIIIVVLVRKNKEYIGSAYYQITKLPYSSVKHNIGRYGEYLTYKCLKNFETNGAKFLFNVYIPKENSETTEIDILMICSKGVFVFESKNYSGWIFGSEDQKKWYQTLPTGRGHSHKEHFYNPIMQNHSHIKHLKSIIDEQVPMWSIIVFSDRCTLKSIKITSNDINVINRHNVAFVVSTICNKISANLLSDRDISDLYNKLYPYTQVDASLKSQHVSCINNNFHHVPIQQTATHIVPVSNIGEPITEQSQTSVNLTVNTDTIKPQVEITDVELIETSESKPFDPEFKKQHILKCPKCNGKLVLRTATRGTYAGNQFYGCSNYPKCKYIKNIAKQAVQNMIF